jgi:tRNA-dihydrouridine synthase B
LLAREFGCDLIWTEMVSDKALTYKNSKTLRILDILGEIQPVVVQLFGSDPEVMAEAAKLVVENGAQIIDINMGCPAPKIVKNCEGSALLKNLALAQSIAKAVVQAVSVPITVKFRLGWDAQNLVGTYLARMLEDVGVAALTVHGRTREQFYSGKADWNAIAEIKRSVKIPVIGNGDVWEPEDAKKMLEETDCDGVMIGRGALGNPWIFRRTVHYLRTGELLPAPSSVDRLALAQRHLELLIQFKSEKIAIQEMRKHAAWYIKGLRDAARIREQIMSTKTFTEMSGVLEQYKLTL